MNSLERESSPTPKRRRRWWIAALIILLVVAGAFVFELPWVLRQPFARRMLKAQADAILAPASVEFDDIILGWRQSTEIYGVTLRDKRGASVLVAEVATFDWSLWQILFARPRTATLSFPAGVLDVERLADGKINLYESLEPILRDKPEREIIVKIDHGRLTVHDHAVPEPFVAESADILLSIAADPGPVTWDVALANSAEGGRIAVNGSRPADTRPDEGDASVSVKVSRWKWNLATEGAWASGELDTTVEAGHHAGHANITGDATIRDLAANGNFRLDTVRLAWDVEGDKDLWTARRLELTAPMGKWLDGDLGVVVDAKYVPHADQVAIGGFTVTTPYGRLAGSGTIDSVKAAPRLDMKGTLEPDWSLVQARLTREVEPNARIAGQSRAWTLSGQGGLDGLRGEVGVQLDALDIYGMRLGATALVVRAEGGRVSFDPIEATLNEGRLHVEPQWVQDRDGSFRLKLGPSTTLENAVVNDEVSHRVLSFAAPVLDGATRVQGRVSLKQVDAEFPLFAADGAHARVEGDVLFDELRFMPGPLADELLSLLPNADQDRPLLVLRDPVSLRIAEGKVHQQGLKFPLGAVGAVALEGSVDFHKNLDLVAKFTFNPPRAADKPLLATILKTARLELPITGTLKEPRIDAQAFQERLKSAGSDLLENSVGVGAEGLMRVLQGIAARRQARLADPDRPPPMTPQQRKELRQERRRERMEKEGRAAGFRAIGRKSESMSMLRGCEEIDSG